MRRRLAPALVLPVCLALASCGSDDDASPSETATSVDDTEPADTSATDSAPSSEAPADVADVVAGEPFPEARCEANREAGTITFLTGFDFAAAASIVDVIVADASGHYEALCLDVELRPGFSPSNYPLIAEGTAEFASGGSFSEVVNFAAANDAEFVVTSIEGRTAIDTLIVKSGEATELTDLAGSTIGVKGKLPTSIDVMLRSVGLVEGEDFSTVILDGFDPVAHISIPEISALPGWKSNEPGALERAGITDFRLFDPLDFDVPGTFGAIFTTAGFIDEHPTAAQDFVRATMRGLADAIADPDAAANAAVELITANGNPSFLSPEGEVFRWRTEADLIVSGTPEGSGFGVPDPEALQAELEAYAAVGLFGEGEVPTATDALDVALTAGVYDADGAVIWPG